MNEYNKILKVNIPTFEASFSVTNFGNSIPAVLQSILNHEIDVGSGFASSQFVPGRFSNAIQKTTNARHAMQVVREDMNSSFVLSLDPTGSATACRGWRNSSYNDGPQVHIEDRIREQFGYRGHWEINGLWVHVYLSLDDSVCPTVSEHSHLVPRHTSEWNLRCLSILPTENVTLNMPLLICQLSDAEPVFGEDAPHIVSSIVPGSWLVLSSGNGLRFKLYSDSVSVDAMQTIYSEYSMDLISSDAWTCSF